MLLKLGRKEEADGEKWKEKIKRLKKKLQGSVRKMETKKKRDISTTEKISTSDIVNIVKTSFSNSIYAWANIVFAWN